VAARLAHFPRVSGVCAVAGFRTVDEFLSPRGNFRPTAAERQLIAACRDGRGCVLGLGERPMAPYAGNRIRAELLRLLIIGGSPDCGIAGTGVDVQGAWIDGRLDLSFATARGVTVFLNCTFPDQPDLIDAKLHRLSLRGSELRRGIRATGMTVGQSVLLSQGFVSRGAVYINGARIGGQLDVTGAEFDVPGRLALVADSMRVGTTFFWRGVTVRRGIVTLAGAQVGALNDDFESWRRAGEAGAAGGLRGHPQDLCLDGFRYDHVWGPTDVGQRLAWLYRGTLWRGRFRPQPYRQFAQALRRQGHDRDARRVLAEMERRIAMHQRRADQRRVWALRRGKAGAGGDIGAQWIAWRGAQAWNWLFRSVTGYGYLPHRALWCYLGLLTVATVVNFVAYRAGVMVPDSPIILTSADWTEAMRIDPDRPALVWAGEPLPPSKAPGGAETLTSAAHYETFNAFAYSLDLTLPILDMAQEDSWGPSTVQGFGTAVWALGWAFKLAGWLISGLGVAAATGIVRRDRG